MHRESKRIFVCYAHENLDLAEKVAKELDHHFPNFNVAVWWDGKIRPGDRWDERIRSQLDQADLVVMLVSGAFDDSSYINGTELPIVLERLRAGKSALLWVAVNKAGDDWAAEHQLGALQAAWRRAHLSGRDERGLASALSEVRHDALGLLDPAGQELANSLNRKYVLKKRLGGGRSWHVYLASDRNLRRDVAVYCPADAEQREALEATVVNATKVANPWFAAVYGAWLEERVPHVIAQYADRGTLATRIAEACEQTGGGLPSAEVRELILRLARALAADARTRAEPLELRPSKVLVDESAGFLISPFGRWRWGFGRQLRRHLAESCASLEQRAYVAPELLSGAPQDLDRTYQYLLGLLAWHAIVGELPRAHDGIDAFPPIERLPVFQEHLPSPNALTPKCSPWLAELVMKMTAREPEHRLASLDEVVKKLGSAPTEELGLVRESYERCLQSEGGADAFFHRVYMRLESHLPPAEWQKFGVFSLDGRFNWPKQHANLAEAVALLLAFYAIDSSNREPTALSRIARKHGKSGYSIAADSFPLFQRALVESVVETIKPESSEHRETLEAAWNKVVGSGIEYLSKRMT